MSSDASSGYSHDSAGEYSRYELSTSDPFVTSSVHKRARSESPVKKNSAFAKWEQREQAEQEQSTPKTGKKMDFSPKKVRDDEWRAGIGRNESRGALRPVELNTRFDNANVLPKAPLELGSPTKENHRFDPPRPCSRDAMPPPARPGSQTHSRGHSLDTTPHLNSTDSVSTLEPDYQSIRRRAGSSEPPCSQPHSLFTSSNSLATLSRSDSMRGSIRLKDRGHVRFSSMENVAPHLDGEDLAKLQNSSTPQLRHLSKMASVGGGQEDMGVHSPDEQVVGLAGRRKLQRSGSVLPTNEGTWQFSSQYASMKWMDTQRKHLQAYEYLCHIGEARAWLEDVLEPVELPAIVQLEEALRDGVTLAEVVVRLCPRLPVDQQRALGALRIFRNPRLQYRHTDNIALFFRFLGEIELPELFRFETVDLYEKKNIPKVIYCIHALSWLLYRKGIVEFRIGNLVGQLQFEEHELEETQKGIDRSGIAMPNFGGMREAMEVEPEPEPQPTPQEILAQHEHIIVDLQSQIRGALMRLKLGQIMQDLWDAEESIAHLQAVARGSFAREIFDFKYAMDSSTRNFQAAVKAYLVRRQLQRKQRVWQENHQAVVKMQSLWRGRQQRAETRLVKSRLQQDRHGTKELQAAIRGALGRWRAGDIWHETHSPAAESDVTALQAQARGAVERFKIGKIMNSLWDVEPMIALLQAATRGAQIRKSIKDQKAAVRQEIVKIVGLQAFARGFIHREEVKRHHGVFEIHENQLVQVQSAARGLIQRLQHKRTRGALLGRESSVTFLQALAKAGLFRQRAKQLRQELNVHGDQILQLQSGIRAMLQRKHISMQLAALEADEVNITTLQSLARAYLQRQVIFEQLVAMEREDDAITQLQAFSRAMLLRSSVGNILGNLENNEEGIAALQAMARGYIVRARFEEKRRHFNENMQKVVKLQSFVRAKQQGESYKSLVSGKNPPLPVVRRHLHLLTDTDLEFESELEAERLRRQVVESIRRNELVESYVEGLDVKIALLVKNKITLDEVVKHQKHFGGSASQLLRQGAVGNHVHGGLDLKALNKNSRKKLSGYEELFFILQTQPLYIARLLRHLDSRTLSEKEAKNLERLTMNLFGYAQRTREEYLFIRLLNTCSSQLISQTCELDDYIRAQNGAFYQRLVHSYVRSPMIRSYLKTLMGGLVKEGICGQDHLDLESDPVQIYRAVLNNEELSTGRPSSRPRDLPREMAIREHDVRPTYVQHLQDLRDLCDGFFLNLEETLHRMPYGMRYLAAEQYRELSQHYPHEDPSYMATLAGNWVWKSYFLPALREPEMWGVVDRGLNPLHKRNLGQVIAVLGQVASGRLFGAENLYLQPLNNWITESLDRWHEALHHMFDLPSIEEYFDADQFSDLYSRTKPTLYIKLADIFAIHSLVADNLPFVAPQKDDQIKELLADLGSAKNNESDLSSASSGGEISLALKSRFTVQEDPNAEARALFMATKRLVLYIIKVQTGNNLMEILCRPISHEDADRWVQLVKQEIAEKEHSRGNRHHRRTISGYDPRASMRSARAQSVYSEAPSTTYSEDRRDLLDLEGMTYAELKHHALENIIALEQPSVSPQYRLSRHNNYQDLLNALAADIRQKHRRRMERQRQIESTRATLSQLDAKAAFLEDQLKSYNDYIEQCLHTLASKKGAKHKFILPFTKQWSHERELEKSGRQPKFGSYKYSARQLADKGVLLSWAGYSPEHWGQLNIVISSDEVGVFHIEASSGSMMLPGASSNLLLDDLLQAQYDNKNAITVFEEMKGGGAKLAVNLLLHQVFKKFYRDE